MLSEHARSALGRIITMIASRLKQANDIASAAEACISTGNHDGAFRIMFDVEQLTYEATTLLNAASLIRREGET